MQEKVRGLRVLATPGCIVLVIGFSVMGYLLLRLLISSNFQSEPNTAAITVSAPETAVPAGEPFLVSVRIRNSIDDEQNLHSIDISSDYLASIPLQDSSPGYNREVTIPFVGFQSFQYTAAVRGRDVRIVELTFIGEQPGVYTGELDVCINSGTICKLFPLSTTIGE